MPELRPRTPRTRSQQARSPSPAPRRSTPKKPPSRSKSPAPKSSEKKPRARSKSPAPRRRKSVSSSAERPEKSEPKSPAVAAPETVLKKTDDKGDDYADGTNWVAGGVEDNAFLFALVCVAPLVTVLLGYLTSEEFKNTNGHPYVTDMGLACWNDLQSCGQNLLSTAMILPSCEDVHFIACFMAVGALLELLPGKREVGPETLTGHVPAYTDNGVRHCLVFSFLFIFGSNVGYGNLYDLGIIYDRFPGSVAFLNIFGIVFCMFLTYKGLNYPSTADCGSSGSIVKDFLWGTELYPRIGNWDLKRFINCRFSMTYWQLAGISYAYKSYTLHGNQWDYGLVLAALSQYLYLFKFFWWEMGYMRSIDIIVDRAGFEIQWGCLVWVPSVYTLHSRFCVQYPSNLSLPAASAIFVLSMLGVVLNYAADRERDVFRATNGQALVWGKKPEFIKAEYAVIDRKTGVETKKTSLLLASGFWGMARHFQYFFELTAAWSWCLLANPLQNGLIPLFYAAFLTYLLIDRANRDSKKCHLKYGKHYEEYCRLVPHKIIPGVY